MESLEFERWERSFLKHLAHHGRSSNTIKNYRTDLGFFRRYLQESRHTLDLANLRPKHIEYYGDYIQNYYKSDNSRRRRIQSLRLFFDYLVNKKVYPDNIVRSLPTSPKFVDIPRPSQPGEVRQLWEYLLKECETDIALQNAIAQRNVVLFLLIYGGGLKVSDLARLERQQIRSSRTSSRVLLVPPKGNPYTVPLPEVFHQAFSEYKSSLRPFLKERDFKEILFNANIWTILSGGLGPRGIEILFERWREQLKIDLLTPKSLRQACIMTWLAQEVPSATIKEWLNLAPSYSLGPYRECVRSCSYKNKDVLEKSFF